MWRGFKGYKISNPSYALLKIDLNCINYVFLHLVCNQKLPIMFKSPFSKSSSSLYVYTV